MEVPASLAGRRIRPADYVSMEVAGLSPAAVSSVLVKKNAHDNRNRGNGDGYGVPLLLARRHLGEAPPRSASGAAAGSGRCGAGPSGRRRSRRHDDGNGSNHGSCLLSALFV